MPKSKKIRVVIDANWFISACINRNSRRTLFKILKNPKLQVLYSKELLAEFDGVIIRAKFSKIISPRQIARFRRFTILFLSRTTIKSTPQIARDTDDNYLLGICASCKADFLITGDQDLLVLRSFQETVILTMRQFQEITSESSSSI